MYSTNGIVAIFTPVFILIIGCLAATAYRTYAAAGAGLMQVERGGFGMAAAALICGLLIGAGAAVDDSLLFGCYQPPKPLAASAAAWGAH